MKTKAIILLAATAVVTLSFTFASVSNGSKEDKVKTEAKEIESKGPIGGFIVEDKIQ